MTSQYILTPFNLAGALLNTPAVFLSFITAFKNIMEEMKPFL